MTTYRDPGWGPALRRGPFLIFVPFMHMRAMRTGKSGNLDGLSVVRMVFLHFIFALLMSLVVLILIVGGEDPAPIPAWMTVAFPVALLGSLGGVAYARTRPLDVSDDAALASSYRTTFFLGIAFAESAALFGFVGVFLVDRLVPYLVGLAVSLVGFAIIAPTRAHIERRQREITALGSPLSLGQALVNAPAAGR